MDHKHYVPILKGKRGDLWALEHLGDAARTWTTPFIEMMPPKDAASVPAQVSALASGISKAWGDSPIFVDMTWVEQVMPANAKLHAVVQFGAAARKRKLSAIPVTGPSRNAAFQAAVASVVGTDGLGVAIRMIPGDLGLNEPGGATTGAATALDHLLDLLHLDRSKADLILDYGPIHGFAQHLVAQGYENMLAPIPNILGWRSLTIAAGSFPEEVTRLVQDHWNALPRVEWLVWRNLVTKRKARVRRRPAYGDYGIRHPSLPYLGFATFAAHLRYSTDDRFFVWRGHAVKMHPLGHDQMHEICTDLIERPEYSGATFSVGDGQIELAADPSNSPGNAESWGKWATNHYLELVCDQIANCPGL